MAEPLKYMYNPAFFERLCPTLKAVIPGFNERAFIHKVFDTRWPDLELKQRTRQITTALHNFLPAEFSKAAKLIVAVSTKLREQNEPLQSYPFIFLPDYIELYGQDALVISLRALEEITKLVSAEFAIRPFLLKYPKETMKQMVRWSKHTDASVRRLASEGCRPRLPWAMGIPALKKDAAPILPILENLKKDSSEYVRRSVANNLNDIAKDHPTLVLRLVSNWGYSNEGTRWIIKHGCRSLLKNGSEEALTLHGFDPQVECFVGKLRTLNKISIGEALSFDFVFCNGETEIRKFRLEYAIDFITRTGKVSRKIFKIGEYNFESGKTIPFSRKQSFKDLTTRKHYKGTHRLRILVNGKEKASEVFQVV